MSAPRLWRTVHDWDVYNPEDLPGQTGEHGVWSRLDYAGSPTANPRYSFAGLRHDLERFMHEVMGIDADEVQYFIQPY